MGNLILATFLRNIEIDRDGERAINKMILREKGGEIDRESET